MLNQIRESKKESSRVKASGFTIIEVMIVLAIAGLIMAIVFLAIPALQKTNRNTQRKNDVSRVAGSINDYVANNNGKLPAALVWPGGTLGTNMLDLTTQTYSILDVAAMGASSISTAVKLTGDLTVSGTATATQPATATGNTAPPKPDVLFYYSNANCGGTNVPKVSTSARSFAIWYGIEGTTTTQCIEG